VFCQIITLFGLTSQRVGGFWKYSEDKVGIGALVIIPIFFELCGLNVLEKEFHCNGNSFLFW
jgi:hypothetical protein